MLDEPVPDLEDVAREAAYGSREAESAAFGGRDRDAGSGEGVGAFLRRE